MKSRRLSKPELVHEKKQDAHSPTDTSLSKEVGDKKRTKRTRVEPANVCAEHILHPTTREAKEKKVVTAEESSIPSHSPASEWDPSTDIESLKTIGIFEYSTTDFPLHLKPYGRRSDEPTSAETHARIQYAAELNRYAETHPYADAWDLLPNGELFSDAALGCVVRRREVRARKGQLIRAGTRTVKQRKTKAPSKKTGAAATNVTTSL